MKSFDGVIQVFGDLVLWKITLFSKIRFFTLLVVTIQYESLLNSTEYIYLAANVYMNDRMR